jgi:hypothetical protein
MCDFLFNIYIQHLQYIQFHSYLQYLDLICFHYSMVHLIAIWFWSGVLAVEPWVHCWLQVSLELFHLGASEIFLITCFFPILSSSSVSRCQSVCGMIAFSSTSSGAVTSQSQHLSSSSGRPRPRPIFGLLHIWNNPPFFFPFCSVPPFSKSLEPRFRLLVLHNLHITSSAAACLQLCPFCSGFQPSQSCVTFCDVTSDHVPTFNLATQLFLSHPYLFLRRFPVRADYCRNFSCPHKNYLSAIYLHYVVLV